MDYCRYTYFKITPVNQLFLSEEVDPIIVRGLQIISENYYYKITDDNGIRYYECVAEISRNRFAGFNDCLYYKWYIENEIILQCNFPVTVNGRKLTENQFTKKSGDFMLLNPNGHNQ